MLRISLAGVFAAAVLLVGCGGNDEPVLVEHGGTATFADDHPDFPHLRFADEQISLNDRCPVRKAKLNSKMPPIYVNGRPIGFC